MKTTIVLLVLAFCLGTALATGGCANCGANDRCCSVGIIFNTIERCYNPTQAQCTFCSRRSSQLCGVNDRCCGDTCYAIQTHQCFGTGSGPALCPINQLPCGSSCYDPNKYTCDVNSGTLVQNPTGVQACGSAPGGKCGPGEQCCPNEIQNRFCFNPSSSFCCIADADIRAVRPVLCPKGSGCCVVSNPVTQAANNICYNVQQEYCDIASGRVCALGSTTNCRTA